VSVGGAVRPAAAGGDFPQKDFEKKIFWGF
jgi:hypothetical protein